MNKTLIRKYYKKGIFKEKHLDIFVKSGDITEQDKKEIMEG
ncbi:MAG: XkdX family protein [Eubacteriales bacterium]